MAPQPSPLLRAAAVGLCAGLFFSGLVLMGLGAKAIFLGPDCSSLTPPECALEGEILRAIGRRQALVGGAVALLGLGLFAYLRERAAGARRRG
jgi:hypothetical protein